MSDMHNSEEQYQDPVPPTETVPTDAPPTPPAPPADVAPPAPPAEVVPPAPPAEVVPPAPPAPPADPYAGEVVPTDVPPAPPAPPVSTMESAERSDAGAVMPAGQPGGYESPSGDASSVIGAGQPGGPPAYEPAAEQQADAVMESLEEIPAAPEADQQPWLDMGSEAEVPQYDQQPWPDMGSESVYVSLDPVELSGCAGMCQQVSGEYEDVAAQLTVTPQLESFAPALTDTLESLRQALQGLATELSGEAGSLQQAGSVVQDDTAGSLPLSSYVAPAFGSDTAVSAAWGSDASAVIGAGQPGGPAAYADASAVIGAGQPGGPAAYADPSAVIGAGQPGGPAAYDPNVFTVGGSLYGEMSIVGGGQDSFTDLLSAINPSGSVVGGQWTSSPTDYTLFIHEGYDYAGAVASANASLDRSGYLSETIALLNAPQPAWTVEGMINNQLGLNSIRSMNQTLFGSYSLFPPVISPIL